jgi:hypothetical protein
VSHLKDAIWVGHDGSKVDVEDILKSYSNVDGSQTSKLVACYCSVLEINCPFTLRLNMYRDKKLLPRIHKLNMRTRENETQKQGYKACPSF